MGPRLACAALLVLLAGCSVPEGAPQAPEGTATASGTPPSTSQAPPGGTASTYRFVQVDGHYERTYAEPRAGVCGFDSPPRIDAERRSIHFYNQVFDANATRIVVAGQTWDGSMCGTADTHALHGTKDPGALAGPFRGFGDLTFTFAAGGAVEVLGQAIAVGANATFQAQGPTPDGQSFEATLTVHNHGPWPVAGITFSGDGSE